MPCPARIPGEIGAIRFRCAVRLREFDLPLDMERIEERCLAVERRDSIS
jgi:hypothetical protein